MKKTGASSRVSAPDFPRMCFNIAVTGHRSSHPAFPRDASALSSALDGIFDQIATTVSGVTSPTGAAEECRMRLLTLLADGSDHLAADKALERDWELVCPLPFGRELNAAINADVDSTADLEAILSGKQPADANTADQVKAIEELAEQAMLFELADQDDVIAHLLRESLASSASHETKEALRIAMSRRAAVAGTLIIEQSDLLIAIWDGKSVESVGGTGHTVATSLEMGVPVLWIDPTQPDQWQLFHTTEALMAGVQPARPHAADLLSEHVQATLLLAPNKSHGEFGGLSSVSEAAWRHQSVTLGHVYRRIETFFGNNSWKSRTVSLKQIYETPDEIGSGSGKPLLDAINALPGQDPELAPRIEGEVMRRFAWTDGISSYLADRYRSGMVLNFVLGAAAIVVGTLYLPLVDAGQKWIFASLELALLVLIIANTAHGQRQRLHGRWFETRRAAEYLRHSPYLLALGVSRSAGRWRQGVNSWWPEWYVRQAQSGVGLPNAKVDRHYLTGILKLLSEHHIDPQRLYHEAKAKRLDRVHHRLDQVSEYSFAAAVLAVSAYLVLVLLSALSLIDAYAVEKTSKWFTVAAVAFPTIGGAIAAIRYFADFERFADISKVTANELERVAERVEALLAAPEDRLDFAKVAQIVHDTDDIVFSEIESWQAVFSGKRTTIPA